MKIKCGMQKKQIDGLTTNHSFAPLPKQERMWALDVKEMKSSSKIDLKDVSWCVSIKYACRPGMSKFAKFAKEGCISLAIGKKPFRTTHKDDCNKCEPPST